MRIAVLAARSGFPCHRRATEASSGSSALLADGLVDAGTR